MKDICFITRLDRDGRVITELEGNMARKPKLGSGKRFAKLAKKTSPALAAYIGRKKYGKKRMAKMSATGRRRASRRRKK